MSKQMPPKVISGGDNPYDIHDAKLSSSATAHESSSVTAHEISNTHKLQFRFCLEKFNGVRPHYEILKMRTKRGQSFKRIENPVERLPPVHHFT